MGGFKTLFRVRFLRTVSQTSFYNWFQERGFGWVFSNACFRILKNDGFRNRDHEVALLALVGSRRARVRFYFDLGPGRPDCATKGALGIHFFSIAVPVWAGFSPYQLRIDVFSPCPVSFDPLFSPGDKRGKLGSGNRAPRIVTRADNRRFL